MLKDIAAILGDLKNQKKRPMDIGVVIITLLISIFGLIMIWSASMYNARIEGDEYYYVAKQLKYLIFGCALAYFISLIDYKYIKKFADLFMGVTLLLLIIVLFLPETEGVGGAVRWISIGGIVIQPSEIAKICVIIFISAHTENFIDAIKKPKTFLIMCVFIVALFMLIYKQPALSAAAIVGVLIIGMYFVAGGNISYMLVSLGGGLAAGYFFISQSEWRLARFKAYLDPWSDLLGSGWQPAQSLMALGSGGIFGQGIGNSRAKLMFLPEPQNDYIFAIIGEELGLIGCLFLIAAYFVLIFKIIKISLHAPDTFSRMFCAGMALLLSVQVAFNVAVVTNLLPSTGVILPFVSAGGSSLVSLMIGMGIMLNISRQQKGYMSEKLLGGR